MHRSFGNAMKFTLHYKVLLFGLAFLLLYGLVHMLDMVKESTGLQSPKEYQLPALPTSLKSGSSKHTVETSVPFANTPRSELPTPSRVQQNGRIIPPTFISSTYDDSDGEDLAWNALKDKVRENMTTYSDEGLTALRVLLTHPSARVRAETADAILQMNLPSASRMLREAALNTTSPIERRRLEQAADFNDLPSVDAVTINELIKKKEASLIP